jgi:DnaJ-domain-containing protein 1
LTPAVNDALVWYPFDRRLFYANAAGALFAAVVAAVSYLAKRLGLRRYFALEFCLFADLADSDPAEAIEGGADAPPHAVADSWFAVLGLSPAASIAEVKDAYKALIKQNHPDRVHGMSPVFRKLAEAESKKINAAYREALGNVDTLASAA